MSWENKTFQHQTLFFEGDAAKWKSGLSLLQV